MVPHPCSPLLQLMSSSRLDAVFPDTVPCLSLAYSLADCVHLLGAPGQGGAGKSLEAVQGSIGAVHVSLSLAYIERYRKDNSS